MKCPHCQQEMPKPDVNPTEKETWRPCDIPDSYTESPDSTTLEDEYIKNRMGYVTQQVDVKGKKSI